MGKRGFAGSALLLLATIVITGSASADRPGWGSGRKNSGGSDARAIQMSGTVSSVSSDRRTIDVRSGNITYRVDISERPDAERRDLRRSVRVEVWGESVGDRSVVATRVRVLGGWNSDVRPDPRDDLKNPRDDWSPDKRPTTREERLLGVVRRRSSQLWTRDIVVSASGTDWTVEVPKDARILRDRESISVHALREGEQVRVSGERTGERKFRARTILVLPEASADHPNGQALDARAYTGTIRDLDTGTGTFSLRVSAFETYTVRATTSTRIRYRGRDVSFRQLRADDRVRVEVLRDPRSRELEATTIEVQ